MPKSTPPAIEYLVDGESSRAVLHEILADCGAVTAGEPEGVTRTFLDSFDGRLFRQDITLEIRDLGGQEHLVAYRAKSGALVGRAEVPAGRFARDLEPGRLRSILEPLLEMRAFAPLVRVRSTVQRWQVRNSDDKLILKISLGEHWAAPPEREEWLPLPGRLRLEPVRGYRKAMGKTCARIENRAGLEMVATPLLHSALAAVGRSPPDSPSKVRVALRANQPAEAAVRAILLRLLDMMQSNEAGTRLDLDSEFLHDFRVAVRRTRSALSQLKGVFPPGFRDRFRTEFAWLGSVTGPTRDLDVYLLSFPAYRKMLPAPLRTDLDPLERLLQRLQRKEQRQVTRALASKRYRTLVDGWRRALEDGVPAAPPPRNAGRPIGEVAAKRIRKAFRRTIDEGAAICAASPPGALHELRKTCKQLRYLLEFFQGLYPAEVMKALIRALKTLQDNLGEYQDLSVQISSMGRFEGQLRAEEGAPPTTLRAIEVLVEAFHRRQAEVREEFAARFAAFSAAETRALLDRALRVPGRAGRGAAR